MSITSNNGIYNPVIRVDKIGTNAIRLTYKNGSTRACNSVIWSTAKNSATDPNPNMGLLNFFQNGAGNTLGFAGIYVGPNQPIDIEGTLYTDIWAVDSWLSSTLNA